MDEYIDRDGLLKDIEATVLHSGRPNHVSAEALGANKVIDRIKSAPTADVVEVVRCKDCENYVANYCCRDIKGRTNMFFMNENDFCSYGKRKEGAGE